MEVRKCVCVSPTMEREQGVSRLVPQRTPPAAAILEVVVSPWHGTFLSAGALSASESHRSSFPVFFFLSLFQSRRIPPTSPLPPSFSAMQIVSFANVKKQVWGGGENGEMNLQPKKVPPYTHHLRPSPHPLVILPSSFE